MIVTILDMDSGIHRIKYTRWEYPNLMELMLNTYYTEIGECKGRGLCGTCIVEVMSGPRIPSRNRQEEHTLKVHNALEKKYRLACQILLDETVLKEIGSQYML